MLKDSLTGAGMYPMPLGPTGISAVDVRDIAEAAAITLVGEGDIKVLTDLLGHPPRNYEDFAREIAATWQ